MTAERIEIIDRWNSKAKKPVEAQQAKPQGPLVPAQQTQSQPKPESPDAQTGWTQEQKDSLTAKLEMLGTLSLLEKQRNLAKKLGRVSPFSRKNSKEDTEQELSPQCPKDRQEQVS